MDDYLDQQSLVAAVETFSQKHDQGQFTPGQKTYRELIPSQRPGPGEQYAFEVDLDKCTGCKACVTACHNENGLEADETWRSVGLVQGGTSQAPVLQHITTACHHCVEPACMKGCPTLAYTKDPETGIVQHLDDQCFGCQYCILKCPYDVPKYDKKRGIVHKCDMCISRLSAGQAPACVRACPNGAIRVTLLKKEDVKRQPSAYVKIPDAPASNYTYPTTRYLSQRAFPANMESVDFYTLKPENSHLPLVWMLVLTQLSVGAFWVEYLVRKLLNPHFSQAFQGFHVPIALGVGLLALGASILHLGRPHLAFRAILGLKTSWLSREILAFSGFAFLAILSALGHWLEPKERFLTHLFWGLNPLSVMTFSVLILGLLGIVCSVMVYRDTQRPFWDNHLTTVKFFLTTVILGSATTLCTSLLLGIVHPEVSLPYMWQYLGTLFGKVILLTTGFKLLLEASLFLFLKKGQLTFMKKTALLMVGPLRNYTLSRFGCGIVGGLVLPLFSLGNHAQISPAGVLILSLFILGISLAGEFLERYLFFRAVVPLKMPGGSQG